VRRPPVFLSRRVPERVRTELERSFELVLHDADEAPSRERLLAAVRGRAGLVLVPTDLADDELLDAAGHELRVIANYAVGYDNVDVEAATRRGIVVTNTPEVLSGATAELTLALLLALVRRVAEGDRLLRRREPWALSPTFMLGRGLEGRMLGIVGLGRIGSEVARLATGFGMEVVYTNLSGPKEAPYEWFPLQELLARADVVSLHCPLTPETHHLVGAEELRAMRSDAVLVNTTRGPVVDEAALAAALLDGEIAGAALDVYEREPEIDERLLVLENVILTPHIGSATEQAREAMGLLCVEALRAVLLEDRCPANAVNPEAWRSR
jgi:glyoxylate reductase